MKIKNIRQYREFYKKIRPVNSSETDEHFIGNFYDNEGTRKYGWFALYHGDKEGKGKADEGISNFLSSFLDMAKDGQAVYEFLQNAVDAGASHFTMAWGKDEVDGNNYLLVANNGDMFNFDSIRSILNVGSSTKTADSQNIGKFGIGFKLAHRLVGKENGLEELFNLNHPSGPILFSWQNGELAQLASGAPPEPYPIQIKKIENGNYQITDENAWLFKILITCFPALPENSVTTEDIRLSDGSKITTPVFNQSEYNALCRWVSKYRKYLTDEMYSHGALFFIKLGLGKENDLADKNLAEGVRFSLAILQETAEDEIRKKHTLQTVQLNQDAPIKKPSLNYLYFQITQSEHLSEYIYIRFGIENKFNLTSEQKAKLSRESDIEVLFGFRDYDKMENYFKGAPNFYLYFPLSEEVHNFNFVLHSNAFYKASSRTFLHKGTTDADGINERLLTKIAKRLKVELLKLYNSDNPKDKNNFLNLYAALLTSSESTNNERHWVKKPFINEVTKVLKELVPSRSDFTSDDYVLSHLSPFIKATAIDLPIQVLNQTSVNWFYWGPGSPDIIKNSAREKLNLKVYDIFHLLLSKGVYTHVNDWIEKDRTRIKTILTELNLFNSEKRSDHFKQNLKNLKLFEFSDGSLLSDNELVEKQDDGYIVLHNQLKNIEPELNKIGITTTLHNLDDFEFYRYYTSYLSPNSQLRSQVKLIELVSNANPEILNSEEKNKVFIRFRDMIEEGKKKERLNEIRMFKNQQGQCVKIKNILQTTDKLWLQPYTIHVDEKSKALDLYLLNDEQLIYERIIYPFWENIASGLITKSPEARKQIFLQISKYYEKSDFFRDSEKQLTEKKGLFFEGSFKKVENPYYHENLAKLDPDLYNILQDVLNAEFGYQIPDADYLSVYGDAPFTLEKPSDILDQNNHTLDHDQTVALLSFCKLCNIDLLGNYTLYSTESGKYALNFDSSNNFHSLNNSLIQYIVKYYDNTFVLFPSALEQFSDLTLYNGSRLAAKLIKELNAENDVQVTDLMEALLHEDEETLALLFNILDKLPFDLAWVNKKNNSVVLGFIKRLLSGDKVEKSQLQAKIFFIKEDSQFCLNSIDSANDDVIVNRKDYKITLSRALILGLDDDGTIRKVLDFVKEATNQQLLTQKEAETIFKIKSDDVTEDLMNHFENNLSDGQLNNAHQLALVLLYPFLERNTLNRFKVLNAAGNWRKLEGNWVLPNVTPMEYYDKRFVLADVYNGLSTLLKLEEKEMFYYGVNNTSPKNQFFEYIIPFFLFQRGCSIDILNKETEDLKKLKYLFGCWYRTPHEQRVNKDKEAWENIFSFNPSCSIYADIVLEKEKLDDSIIKWIQESEHDHIKLLSAIGVQTKDSNIVKLRSWLMDGDENTPPPVMISQTPFTCLSNTLIGLAEGFVNQQKNEFVFTRGSNKHKLINEIISKLHQAGEDYEIRIPVWHSVNNLCLGNQRDEMPKFLSDKNYEILISDDKDKRNETLISSIQVIVSDELYNDFVYENYEKIKIKYNFIEPIDSKEHDEPFYKTWNKNNDIRLFRISSVNHKAYLINGEDIINLGTVSFGNFYLTRNGDSQNIYYRSEISLETLKSDLENKGFNDISELLQELIVERNKMLTAFYNTLTSIGKNDFDNEDTKRLLESFKERNKDEERNEIVKNIKSSVRYSYDWFESYINYLLTFEDIADTTAQKSISFQSIEAYSVNGKISDKYFILKGANSLIPLNIEAFEDFNINLVFRSGSKENIIVEGVSKKGQDLLTYIPKGIESKLTSSFSQVLTVKINFSPVLDLVKRLYDAFTNKSIIAPWENIQEALQPLHFIYGPPGTGKTTKLCNILNEEHSKNHVLKALVLVPTNKAGDVLAKKLLLVNEALSVIRIGSATDPELEQLDEGIYQVSLTDLVLDGANVVISTIHRFPYYQVSKEHGAHFKLFEKEALWDLVIFDESSMLSLPYIVFALLSLKSVNPDTKYYVAGDPKQIPAIVDTTDKNLENLNMEDESIYKMLKINSFDKEEQLKTKRENDVIENLNIQYRAIEPIGKLFSEFSYENLLQHGRDLSKEPRKILPDSFITSLKNPVSLINFLIDNDTSVLQPRKLLYSSYHVYAGILASEILKFLDDCNIDNTNYSIGVISPYKAQALLMNKLIVASGISNNLQIKCDTVHGFQGDQCDIIIFVINPNNHYYTGHKNSLLSKKYVYNVAISRARDYLWILNPFEQIKNNPHVQNMQRILGNNVSVINSKVIENILFNDADFIVHNSYLTGHDSINVFGQVDMKYFIKSGNTAIDIQLKK